MENEDLKDKKLYCYKQALSQPYWIQKLNEDFSLPSPVRFSRIVYFVIFLGLFYYTSDLLLGFFPFGLRFMLSFMGALVISSYLSEMVVDGKAIVFYIKDYLIFWFKYGYRSERIYVNKGKIYEKPEIVIGRKERYEARK